MEGAQNYMRPLELLFADFRVLSWPWLLKTDATVIIVENITNDIISAWRKCRLLGAFMQYFGLAVWCCLAIVYFQSCLHIGCWLLHIWVLVTSCMIFASSFDLFCPFSIIYKVSIFLFFCWWLICQNAKLLYISDENALISHHRDQFSHSFKGGMENILHQARSKNLALCGQLALLLSL